MACESSRLQRYQVATVYNGHSELVMFGGAVHNAIGFEFGAKFEVGLHHIPVIEAVLE